MIRAEQLRSLQEVLETFSKVSNLRVRKSELKEARVDLGIRTAVSGAKDGQPESTGMGSVCVCASRALGKGQASL